MQARWHVYSDHPADYEVCMANLPAALVPPFFVGQAPRQPENFEIVKRLAGSGGLMLAALSLRPNDRGNHNVVSSYLISARDLEERRAPPPRLSLVMP